jgi:regulator of protease activity HflC (stomatin/prohibitin superfamily)
MLSTQHSALCTSPMSSLSKHAYSSMLFYAAVLLLPVVGGLSADYYGYPHALLGAGLWLTLFGFVFLVRVAFFSITLLPPDLPNRQEEAFTLILQHYWEGSPTASGSSANPVVWDGVPPSIEKFRAGVVDSHIALALGKGEGFARAAGPGYVQLRRGERIKHVLDLRHHQRDQGVQVVTRDGIPCTMRMGVVFRVRRLTAEQIEEQGAQDKPYPYDPSAIFQVSYFSTYGEGESEIPWTERIIPLAEVELVTALANYTVDQLHVQATRTPAEPHLEMEKLEELVREQLQRRLLESGVEIVAIELSDLLLPPDVRQQRIANWQADWQRQAQVALARGDAAAVQSMEEARTAAELAFIRQIMATIEQQNPSGPWRLTDVVNLAALQALEGGASEMPSQLLPALNYVREVAGQGGTE